VLVVRMLVGLVLAAGCGPGVGTSSSAGESGTENDTTTSSAESGTENDSTAPACGEDDVFVPVTEPCEGGEPVLQPGDAGPTGLAVCPDGSVHSYGIACCGGEDVLPCTADGGQCATDSDCTMGSLGVCRSWFPGDFCMCFYGHCTTDADCEPDQACICASQEIHTSTAACRRSGCRTDQDCGGHLCGLNVDDCDNPLGLECHTPNDECHGPEDCGGDGWVCAYRNDPGHWVCQRIPPCE
jgi:hypothetical protein